MNVPLAVIFNSKLDDFFSLLIFVAVILLFCSFFFFQVFDGNCDHFTPVINRFNPVRARFVKVIPHDNPQSWMCMRLEFYGCDS